VFLDASRAIIRGTAWIRLLTNSGEKNRQKESEKSQKSPLLGIHNPFSTAIISAACMKDERAATVSVVEASG
jgi:hypothetical protein